MTPPEQVTILLRAFEAGALDEVGRAFAREPALERVEEILGEPVEAEALFCLRALAAVTGGGDYKRTWGHVGIDLAIDAWQIREDWQIARVDHRPSFSNTPGGKVRP